MPTFKRCKHQFLAHLHIKNIDVHSRKVYRSKGGLTALTLNLGTTWNLVFSFTPRTIYYHGSFPCAH